MKHFCKKISLLILFLSTAVLAQNGSTSGGSQRNIRLNLYGAYAFDDKFDASYNSGYYYEGTLKGGFQYGGGLDFEAAPGKHIEILYLRQDTEAPVRYYTGSNLLDGSITSDVTMNYIMLGASNSFRKPGSKVEGFGGFMLGVGIVNVDSPNFSDSSTKFAWGLRAGGIVWGSEKVGVKLQAQLLSIAQSVGGGFYVGTGGAGTGVSTYSSIYQFCLGGGLVFNVGK